MLAATGGMGASVARPLSASRPLVVPGPGGGSIPLAVLPLGVVPLPVVAVDVVARAMVGVVRRVVMGRVRRVVAGRSGRRAARPVAGRRGSGGRLCYALVAATGGTRRSASVGRAPPRQRRVDGWAKADASGGRRRRVDRGRRAVVATVAHHRERASADEDRRG